jgi:hypothetical protein
MVPQISLEKSPLIRLSFAHPALRSNNWLIFHSARLNLFVFCNAGPILSGNMSKNLGCGLSGFMPRYREQQRRGTSGCLLVLSGSLPHPGFPYRAGAIRNPAQQKNEYNQEYYSNPRISGTLNTFRPFVSSIPT